jgi:hypothetical protein
MLYELRDHNPNLPTASSQLHDLILQPHLPVEASSLVIGLVAAAQIGHQTKAASFGGGARAAGEPGLLDGVVGLAQAARQVAVGTGHERSASASSRTSRLTA